MQLWRSLFCSNVFTWGGGGMEWGVVRFTSYSCMCILIETTKISKTTKIKCHIRKDMNKVVINKLFQLAVFSNKGSMPGTTQKTHKR